MMRCMNWLNVQLIIHLKRTSKKIYVWTDAKIIPLSHHLWPTRSVWRSLYLQRPYPLPGFSYFTVFRTFLGINLLAVVCSPQPLTARRAWDAGLCKNVATNWQHMGPPKAHVLWAGEEGPILNAAFTNSNWRILLIIPLTHQIKLYCSKHFLGSPLFY